jgi:hypothetical protein
MWRPRCGTRGIAVLCYAPFMHCLELHFHLPAIHPPGIVDMEHVVFDELEEFMKILGAFGMRM